MEPRAFTEETSVGEIAAYLPAAADVFERRGIDFCCGGRRPLRAVCDERGLDARALLEEIAEAGERESEADAQNWTDAPLTELCRHIAAVHHSYVLVELPRIEMLLDKINYVHGDHHPELRTARRIFLALSDELQSHLRDEEAILFPYVVRLETAEALGMPRPKLDVSEPIRQLEDEHEAAGDALHELRRITNNYAPPSDACATFRRTYAALEALERDLHRHIHLENNILHPRAHALLLSS